ncbi:putative GPI-anchored protein [Apostasia shenzhenica]|uniref:Putative GPI-anchored protein n=1 Tax=Apostasia shenzhenica TaxID=1088818 RepID=A0A2H9ZZD7_9ASPA|nr:putative GPI-anchored protein [Apostasia shenzhenica]
MLVPLFFIISLVLTLDLLQLPCCSGLQKAFCILDNVTANSLLQKHDTDNTSIEEMKNTLLPYISPDGSPEPFIPFLAPSPLPPFVNNTNPKLSGSCILNFTAVGSLMRTTSVDCYASFAPLLANVICCPQLHATLAILLGKSSKRTGMLALDSSHANYCLSDFQKILASQGASYMLEEICSVHPSNLSEGSCPVSNIDGVESAIDSPKLLAACKTVDPVNECCRKRCQNAILDAAGRLAMRGGGSLRVEITINVAEKAAIVDDCKSIILRWLSCRLDTLPAAQLLRRVSNCDVNGVCPLVFPETTAVAKDCGNEIENYSACCKAMNSYITHLQKQSFITNLQAVGCAAYLGLQLQKVNVSKNVYRFCQITLKDFSLQVAS